MDNEKLVVPQFKVKAVQNAAKSQKQGRPIFDDLEVVEVRYAGNRNTVSVFPAHAFARWVMDDGGNQVKQTYAERWPEQYKRFKAKQQQVADGTPIDELSFLTAARRSELKALSIYTAEALAALDGQNLKNLGQGGRDLKNQAQAYIDNARGTADVVAMAAQIEALKRTVMELQGQSPFKDWEPDQIKDWIEQNTGERPKGNPNHATLVKRADEIAAAKEAA